MSHRLTQEKSPTTTATGLSDVVHDITFLWGCRIIKLLNQTSQTLSQEKSWKIKILGLCLPKDLGLPPDLDHPVKKKGEF